MSFIKRHIGLDKTRILNYLNLTEKEFISRVIPKNIISKPKNFKVHREEESLKKLRENFKDKNYKYLIGLDFHESLLPTVIKRNLLENPKWYTAYTPYQSEISQGRLESLFNFQTLISELTSLPITNCSLLDSGSSSVEALNMAYVYHRKNRNSFFVDENVHPHIKEILKTRSDILGLDLQVKNIKEINITPDLLGAYFSYPDTYGRINFFEDIIEELNKNKSTVITHNDPLSLMIFKSPGEIGVDISVGTTQRFGLPLWFGGPHSSFIATKEEFLRLMPGRIVGESKDRNNMKCFRLALQTREQHIKRDKALSNICTSQALLANVSSMFAIYHGKEGLSEIALDVFTKKETMKYFLRKNYPEVDKGFCFDTIRLKKKSLYPNLKKEGFYPRILEDEISFSINEATSFKDCKDIINICNKIDMLKCSCFVPDKITVFHVTEELFREKFLKIKESLKGLKSYKRDDNFLNQEIFKEKKSETWMMRYINHLGDKDYSLVSGMIPLGSCTMKLNSASQLEPLSWSELMNKHPYTEEMPRGYKMMINKVSSYLLNLTDMKKISYQSNSGAMGEYTGLLCIKKYHSYNNESYRNLILIPESAHGTNFTSAILAGMKILKYNDKLGLSDFKKIVEDNKEKLAGIMITYPNTYGIFDENIKEITNLIHKNGGLVYMDGANMNAQTGWTSPGSCGADVCHLNIHKTFCIPHGGGGPGLGPICVNEKLEKFLPSNNLTDKNYFESDTIGMITSSNYSSASLLAIPYIYFKTTGLEGQREATLSALLASNYLKKKLEPYYNIYMENKLGLVGHEFIIDLNNFKDLGIKDKDIAKRLIDYNFHPPTMSWPVPNSLMIEPTESENLEELDRFVEAMISIYKEIEEVRLGYYSLENNVLKNSPHSLKDLENWNFDYSLEKAFFPLPDLKEKKHWPTHSRIDDIYGDKNLKLKSLI